MELKKNFLYIILLCFFFYNFFLKNENMSNSDTYINSVYNDYITDLGRLTKVTKELASTGKITINGNLTLSDNCNLSSLPRGSIVAWASNNIPKGWVLCDGNNGTLDLRGRFIYGIDPSKNKIGDKGGAETHTLTGNEMPSHNHTASTSNGGEHSHGSSYKIPSGSVGTQRLGWKKCGWGDAKGIDSGSNNSTVNIKGTSLTNNGSHSHSFTPAFRGKGHAHNNMPPYYVINWIMKK